MLEFGNSVFYIDLKAFDKAITLIDNTKNQVQTDTETKTVTNENGDIILTEHYERSTQQGKEIDATKYDLLKTFIEYIIDYDDEAADDALGLDRALSQMPLGYKIVYNTLLNENILIEKEI
jgi:hypothetical protein